MRQLFDFYKDLVKRPIVLALFFSGLFFYQPLQAAVNSQLYQASVSVTSQAEDVRIQGFEDALAVVLVKVSGNQEIDSIKRIKQSLSQAEEYVQTFTYLTNHQPDRDSAPFLLRVSFDSASVDALLQSNKQPIWQAERPTVLLWLGIKNDQRWRVVADAEDEMLRQQIMQSAAKRGLTIFLPLYDLTDASQVSADDILQNRLPFIEAASKRYSASAIAIGNVQAVSPNHWQAEWTLAIGAQQQRWRIEGDSVENVVNQGIDAIADDLAQQEVTSAEQNNAPHNTILRIVNVSNATAYHDVLAYLRSLPTVEDVDLVSLNSSDIILKVTFLGSAGTFTNALLAGNKLMPSRHLVDPFAEKKYQSKSDNEITVDAVYQWLA